MDGSRARYYLKPCMRLLLALLALLTGLSFPDVALATSRMEVADSGVSVAVATPAAPRAQSCAGQGGEAPRKRSTVQRKMLRLPTVALARTCGILLSDRGRE